MKAILLHIRTKCHFDGALTGIRVRCHSSLLNKTVHRRLQSPLPGKQPSDFLRLQLAGINYSGDVDVA